MNENNLNNNVENNNVVNDNTATIIPIPDPAAQATVPNPIPRPAESMMDTPTVAPTPVEPTPVAPTTPEVPQPVEQPVESQIVQPTPIQTITPTPIPSESVAPQAPVVQTTDAPLPDNISNPLAPQAELSSVQPEVKKKKMNPLILVLVFILILAGGTAAWYFISLNNMKKNTPVGTTTTTKTTTKAPTSEDKLKEQLETSSDAEKKYSITRKVSKIDVNEDGTEIVIDFYLNDKKMDYSAEISISGLNDKDFKTINEEPDYKAFLSMTLFDVSETSNTNYLLLKTFSLSENGISSKAYVVDKEFTKKSDIDKVSATWFKDQNGTEVIKDNAAVVNGEIHYIAKGETCDTYVEKKTIIGEDGTITDEVVQNLDTTNLTIEGEQC